MKIFIKCVFCSLTVDSIFCLPIRVFKFDHHRFGDLLPILLAYVQSRQAPGKPVLWVAHNAKKFDVPFVMQEFERCSAQVPADWLFVDSLCLARKLKKSDGTLWVTLTCFFDHVIFASTC